MYYTYNSQYMEILGFLEEYMRRLASKLVYYIEMLYIISKRGSICNGRKYSLQKRLLCL